MGCQTHDHGGVLIRFSEANDDWSCLCTFPHNDGESLSVGRLRSLALYGAVCAMIDNGEFSEHKRGDYIFLPDQAPNWLVKEIERLIPDEH